MNCEHPTCQSKATRDGKDGTRYCWGHWGFYGYYNREKQGAPTEEELEEQRRQHERFDRAIKRHRI